MLVFIDESGDSGFKLDRGSSRYFVIVAVIFTDEFSASACERAIDCLRRELSFPPCWEFHFKKCPDKVREAFFRRVANERFWYHAFVLDKQKLCASAPTFRDGKSFYQFAVSIVCDNARSLLQDAKIVIDKTGDRPFRQELQKRLRRHITDDAGRCLIRKVGMEPSHSNSLVQLADMVCGAVSRSIQTGRAKGDIFRKLISSREKRVQLWPKN
jgi:hypothetical protein